MITKGEEGRVGKMGQERPAVWWRKLNFWWWVPCKINRSPTIILYTWNLHSLRKTSWKIKQTTHPPKCLAYPFPIPSGLWPAVPLTRVNVLPFRACWLLYHTESDDSHLVSPFETRLASCGLDCTVSYKASAPTLSRWNFYDVQQALRHP